MRYTRRVRSLLRVLAGLAATLVSIELASRVAVALIAWRKPDAFYSPRAVGSEEYARYLAERDPVLGWPRPKRLSDAAHDAAGSRVVPAFPDPAGAATLVSLYGDSMTESLEVDDEAAWGNQLSRRLGARVANYGVAGFGTDQAYLRYLSNPGDTAKIVFLSHFTDDALRNVNQWRYLISTSPGAELTFKPRFVLDGQELRLIPLPAPTYAEYLACSERPGSCLPHEFFLPDDGRSGIQTARFPYALTLLHAFDNFVIGAKLAGEPRHARHYRRDHPSGAEPLTRAILRAFVAEARRRGQIPVVALIPDGKDLEFFAARGVWTYQPLVDDLAREDGIEVLDFGPALIEKLGGRSPCEIVNRCYDHFNAEGYRMLAEIALAHLQRTGIAREAAVGGAPPGR